MSIVQKMKECEGCRKRRRFLKEVFGGLAVTIGLGFLWPSKAKGQLNCECQHCLNGDICLCCDPGCDHCSISSRERCCVHVLEFCAGVPTYTAVCCANGQCPGLSQTGEPVEVQSRWKIILSNSTEYTILSSNKDLDPQQWLTAHSAKFTDKNGKAVKIVTANKEIA